MSYVSRYLDPALIEQLNQMTLSARSVVQGGTTGQHRSPIKGASVEFRQHRFYVPGDEPRRLDWRVLARTDRPYIKEYDEETNLRCVLMLDRSGSMAYGRQFGTKFDYAARLVAAMAYIMLGQTESVGVAVCGNGVEQWLAPHAGPAHLAGVVDALESGTPAGQSGLDQAMHDVAERLERRALIIILSDFFLLPANLRSGLAHLRHERHEVVCVQVIDRDEEQFPFRNWVRFRGLENESSQLCEPVMLRKIYLEAFREQRKILKEICMALQVEFQFFVTDKPIMDAIKQFVGRHT